MAILDLPFRELPIHELLHFDEHRREVDDAYAGCGWARVPRIWLGDTPIDDALVLGLHSCDIGEVLPDDIELEFELPDGEPVTVLASQFLELWLPKLPAASAIVLAMCNPHHAELRRPAAATAPVYYATGDVEAWIDHDDGGRLELLADGSWARLDA